MPGRSCLPAILLSLTVANVPFAAETSSDDAAGIRDVLSEDIGRFKKLMSSPVAEYRVEGAQGAYYLRLAVFEPELIRLLDDKSPSVRQEAVRALSHCGTWRSIGPLIVLLNDSDWPVREYAHRTLCRMTAQSFDTSPKTPWEVWWNGSSIAQKQERLFADLMSQDAELSHSAARALRCLATDASEDRLLELLKQGAVRKHQAVLFEALDRVGTAKSMPYFLETARAGQRTAAWALGRRGGVEAEEALLKGLQRNRSLDFLLNLDRVHSAKCGPFLAPLCQSFASVIRAGRGEDLRYPPSPLRRVSANLIRRCGQGPLLVDLILAEMEGQPKEAAIPNELKPLFQDLRQILKPEFVREGFSHCDPLLGAFYDLVDDRAIVPRLIPLLRSQCLLVRIYAGLSLGKLRAAEAVGPMVAVIDEGYSFSDSTAPASAKHTGETRVVDGKPQRQSQTVRWLGYLCTALGHIGTEDARKALEALATNPQSPRDVRYGSVIGLGHLGSMDSLPALRAVAERDIIWMIRDVAGRTIKDMEIAYQARQAEAGTT